jgi:hypothetical protein
MKRHHEASSGCKVMDEGHLKSLQSHKLQGNIPKRWALHLDKFTKSQATKKNSKTLLQLPPPVFD